MEQDAQSSACRWSRRRILILVGPPCLAGLAVLASVWLWQRPATREAICAHNMRAIQGAWCTWAMAERVDDNSPRAPTWQDLDGSLGGVGGYRGLKCPAGGQYLFNHAPGVHHGDNMTCTVHGALFRKYPQGRHPHIGLRWSRGKWRRRWPRRCVLIFVAPPFLAGLSVLAGVWLWQRRAHSGEAAR